MRFNGKVFKDGKFWLVEIPILDAMTQGHTKKEAFVMAKDLIESLVDKTDFSVEVIPKKDGKFEVCSNDTRTMISLLLRRQREHSGLTLSEASERLGAKSRNAYARYEQGLCNPTVEKLIELLNAVSPDKDIVINQVS